MSSKKEQEMNTFFNIIIKEGITPNQFYLLYCFYNKLKPELINTHLELRALTLDKWIDSENKLTTKALALMSDKPKTDIDNVSKYNELFPRKKLPSGKFARTNTKNLESAFIWFFKTYEYTWDVVLKATAMYVDEYEKKNYMYMQTSQYFIRKQQIDKTWGSELANWCAMVESGEDLSDDNHFKQKVV